MPYPNSVVLYNVMLYKMCLRPPTVARSESHHFYFFNDDFYFPAQLVGQDVVSNFSIEWLGKKKKEKENEIPRLAEAFLLRVADTININNFFLVFFCPMHSCMKYPKQRRHHASYSEKELIG